MMMDDGCGGLLGGCDLSGFDEVLELHLVGVHGEKEVRAVSP